MTGKNVKADWWGPYLTIPTQQKEYTMDFTIEEYLEYQNSLLEQAEEDGFTIESVDEQ
jgi:hypothetical protein